MSEGPIDYGTSVDAFLQHSLFFNHSGGKSELGAKWHQKLMILISGLSANALKIFTKQKPGSLFF